MPERVLPGKLSRLLESLSSKALSARITRITEIVSHFVSCKVRRLCFLADLLSQRPLFSVLVVSEMPGMVCLLTLRSFFPSKWLLFSQNLAISLLVFHIYLHCPWIFLSVLNKYQLCTLCIFVKMKMRENRIRENARDSVCCLPPHIRLASAWMEGVFGFPGLCGSCSLHSIQGFSAVSVGWWCGIFLCLYACI